MSGSAFHVQGRLVEHRGSVVVRDETRRVDADSRDEAFRIAGVLRGDGFTVWVWAVDARTVPSTLTLVERLAPGRAPGVAARPGGVTTRSACRPGQGVGRRVGAA